jgi:hypothetical protein
MKLILGKTKPDWEIFGATTIILFGELQAKKEPGDMLILILESGEAINGNYFQSGSQVTMVKNRYCSVFGNYTLK